MSTLGFIGKLLLIWATFLPETFFAKQIVGNRRGTFAEVVSLVRNVFLCV